jgi:hypothetical protein
MRRSRFDSTNAKIIEFVTGGETLTGACERVGLSVHTAGNWISNGHRNPEGPYGRFAEALDAARASARLHREEEDGYELGPVEREVRSLIAGRPKQRRSAAARTTPPQTRARRSAAGASTPPAANGRRSAAAALARPVVTSPRSAAASSTRQVSVKHR